MKNMVWYMGYKNGPNFPFSVVQSIHVLCYVTLHYSSILDRVSAPTVLTFCFCFWV